MYCTKNEVFHFPADLVTFTEEIVNGKRHFLCSDVYPLVYPFVHWSLNFYSLNDYFADLKRG